ncbi:MAG: HU family DNA-binding protein [Bacteroidales bacterium]|jgi:predicted histone-like DNA-binding protein|nr:HU family DNA-binding protein [Bacteroidales bacterium]
MAIEYIRVQKRITSGYSPGDKFLVTKKKTKKVKMSQVYDDITDLSSLSRGDVKSAIDNFFHVIGKYFKDGRGIDMEEFGEFEVTLNARSVETLEEANASTIKRVNVNYRLGTKLRKELKDVSKVLGSLEVKGYQPRNPTDETP